MLQMLLNGLILGFVASPSCPSNAEEIRLGTRYHAGYALLVGVGAVTGDIVVLFAVLFGLVPLLTAYPILKTSLWLIAAVVMAYVSWGIFKEAKIAMWNVGDEGLENINYLRAFWVGFAITTLNPFTALWWVCLRPCLNPSKVLCCFL